jgi:uncharacterized protein (UPF0276 family)
MINTLSTLHGAGLGLRRTHMGPLADLKTPGPDFLEVAPENWMGIGGALGKQFSSLTECHNFVLHGLSLNLGGMAPLDETFLYQLKKFMKQHNINVYSEHLSYCADEGHLYDLMPIPFTDEAVSYVASRIRQTQDILEQPIAIENVSYYASPNANSEQKLSEIDFINAVIDEAGCDLLLDVNNIYVNSINHGYDAKSFLRQIPGDRIKYIHVAGHYIEDTDLIIDTHGAAVVDPVWELLEQTYKLFGVKPTLLERDFNLPPLDEMLLEVQTITHYQDKWSTDYAQSIQNG